MAKTPKALRRASKQAAVVPATTANSPAPEFIQVVRSFSYKLNLGRINPLHQYESVDIFCSQKAFCRPEEAEATSEAVYGFCKAQVLGDVRAFTTELKKPEAKAESAYVSYPKPHPLAKANARAFEQYKSNLGPAEDGPSMID